MDNREDPANLINANSFTSSNEPLSSSKKLSNDENGYNSMKQEIIKQQKIIYDQASTICELHEERRMLKNGKDELERIKEGEAELQLKIDRFEAHKKMAESDLVKLKADMNDQISQMKKENEEKNTRIKKMEEQLLAAKDIKPDPKCNNEKEVKIKELESICNSREKKIVELEAQLQSKANTETSLLAEMTQMEQNNNDQTKILQAENDRLKATVEEHEKKDREMVKMLEAKQNIITQLQFRLEEMEKCYKADLKKNEEDKRVLKDQHDKKMANMKAEMQEKIDNERKEQRKESAAAAAINRLTSANTDLLGKISQYHRSALSSSTSATGEFQSSAIKDVWTNDCRTACHRIFDEHANYLLQQSGEKESVDEILKKLKEEKYNSPNELNLALTEVIQRSLNNCDRRSAKHRSLIILNQSLDNKFKPIMENYTRMANERTVQKRTPLFNAFTALNRIQPNTLKWASFDESDFIIDAAGEEASGEKNPKIVRGRKPAAAPKEDDAKTQEEGEEAPKKTRGRKPAASKTAQNDDEEDNSEEVPPAAKKGRPAAKAKK